MKNRVGYIGLSLVSLVSRFDPSNLRTPPATGLGIPGTDYNTAFRNMLDQAEGDCCKLLTGAIKLIDAYTKLLNYHRVEWNGPSAYRPFSTQQWTQTNGGKEGVYTTAALFQLQNAKCDGGSPEDTCPSVGGPGTKLEIPSLTAGIPIEINLPYSPFERYRHWDDSRPQLGVPSQASFRYEENRLRRQLQWGIIPERINELPFSKDAIDRVLGSTGNPNGRLNVLRNRRIITRLRIRIAR